MSKEENKIMNEIEEQEKENLDDSEDSKKGRKTKEESRHYVQINDHFRFSSDKYCFILEKFVPSKVIERGKFKGQTSTDKWVEVGYHGQFQHLVKYCIQYYIRDAFGDLKEIYKRIAEMEQMIEETLPNLYIDNGVCKIRPKSDK